MCQNAPCFGPKWPFSSMVTHCAHISQLVFAHLQGWEHVLLQKGVQIVSIILLQHSTTIYGRELLSEIGLVLNKPLKRVFCAVSLEAPKWPVLAHMYT
jgi:hypothetical protein